jgi:hypothetical protein
MALSPMQMDYVTKDEFGEFRDEFEDFRDGMGEFKTDTLIKFDNIDAEIKRQTTFTREGFEKMEEFITNSFTEFGDKLDKKLDIKFANSNRVIISQLDKRMNEKLEKTKLDIISAIYAHK